MSFKKNENETARIATGAIQLVPKNIFFKTKLLGITPEKTMQS